MKSYYSTREFDAANPGADILSKARAYADILDRRSLLVGSSLREENQTASHYYHAGAEAIREGLTANVLSNWLNILGVAFNRYNVGEAFIAVKDVVDTLFRLTGWSYKVHITNRGMVALELLRSDFDICLEVQGGEQNDE